MPFRNLFWRAALTLVFPAVAWTRLSAQVPASTPKEESQATLSKQAKISLAAATATALKTVPGATVKSHEIERENGKLIYSFDMKTAGKSGIDEVNVDAITGATVGKVQHESDTPPRKPAVKKP